MPLADTLRRLPPAATDYARSIFDHHWLEASWLYERRAVLRTQGALLSADGWLELEARTDAHVMALARGDHLVLDACEDKALEGDVGELHTAVRILCLGDEPERFDALVDRIDWAEPARAWAVTDALTWDAPESWRELVEAMLTDEGLIEEAIGPLARVAGMRGWPVGDALLGVLEDRAGDLAAVTWALGVLHHGDALAELYAVIQEPVDGSVRQAASIAALRFAPGEVLAFLEHVVDTEAWAAVPMAIGGGPSVWPALMRSAKASPTEERLLAIGLFGNVEGIELLLGFVEDEELGEAAAEGLYLLTGAELFEERYEGGAEDEDGPLGLLVKKLPRSRGSWEEWLRGDDGVRIRASGGTRVRVGEVFHPDVALRETGRVAARMRVREWMVEELDTRYRLDLGSWPRRLIHAKPDRVQLNSWLSMKILAGKWYLSSHPL